MKEELFIGGTRIDLLKDANILVTKRLFDIENPNVRAYDFTKNIQAAGSKVNNELFDFIFNTNSAIQNTSTTNFNPDFNPNLKATAEYYVDSVLIMDGTAQMIDMVVNDGKITYNIYIFGKQIDLFEKLGDSKLNELDLSAYDHTYNYTNIAASWALTYTNGYVYPMVDYKDKVDWNDWYDSDFKPAVYDHVIINKLLSNAGFTYTSAFIDSARFKKYIVPFSLDKMSMTSSDVEDERFKVSLNTLPTTIASKDLGTSNSLLPLIIFDDDTGGDLTNTSGTDFNTTTGKYEPVANYTQRFKLSLDFKIEYSDASAQGNITTNQNYVDGGVVKFAATFSVLVDDGTTINKLGTIVSNDLDMTATGFVYNSTDGTIAPNDLTNEITLNYTSPEVYIKNGYKVYVVLELVEPSLSYYGIQPTSFPYKNSTYIYEDYSIKISDCSFEGVISNPELNIGDSIPISDTLPDYTQKDYLMDLVKQHNLIIEIDPTNPTNLLIEPMVDYYNSTVNDLTPYLVNDKDFNIKPMGYLDGKKYILSYAKGEGEKNKEYQDKYKRIYGDFELDVNNDFQTEDKRVDLQLIPTPSVGTPDSNNRVIPYIRDERDKPRRLYWGGLLTSSNFTILEGGITSYARTTYPYAGHLDDPYTPTLDLNFGTPKMIFWDNTYPNTPQINYTNNNLHAGYWYNYLQEITDKDSKVIEAYFYLTPYRMRQLDFKQLHLVDNTYYRLIEIVDYDRTQPITKLKLLKTQYITPISITTGLANGGSGGLGTWDRLPTLSVRTQSNELITQGDNPSKIQGDLQIVSGEGNLTAKGLSGGALINCTDRVLSNNEVWISDVNVEQKAVIELSSAMIKELATVSINVLPQVGSGRYIQITGFTGAYTYGTAAYTAYTLTLQTDTTNTELANLPAALYSGGSDTYKKATTIVDSETVDIGEGVELVAPTNPITGDGTIKLTIYYKIIEI